MKTSSQPIIGYIGGFEFFKKNFMMKNVVDLLSITLVGLNFFWEIL